ncbi:MAG: FAD-dependent oxidoreductase [Rhodobacteraceae bacterium]|nr:FAD-dependent oxidoreductase [Paracoccaceae bacterium]
MTRQDVKALSPSKSADQGPDVSKRTFLAAAAASVVGLGASRLASAADDPARWDLIVVGGGNSGLPAAIFAARRNAKVLVIEAAGQVGGTLFLSSGQMSAAGTKLQKSKGIVDTPQLHYDDIMRISKGTANPGLVRIAVDGNGETFDWLMDNGLKVGAEHPILGTTHEPYSVERYAWSTEKGGLAILEILERNLQPEIDKGNVKVLTSTEAVDLIMEGGAVVGVVSKGEDGTLTRHRGTNILLTCGGYVSNPAMFEKYEGVRKYNDSSYPYSQGIGVKLAEAAGGFVHGGNLHAPLFGGILQTRDYPSPMMQIFRPWPATRPPWEIWVNIEGQRFVSEDVLSHDAVEEGILKQPGNRAWVVFDETAIKNAPQILSTRQYTREDYLGMFNEHDFFFKDDTIEGLAKRSGVDPKGLSETIAAYNKGQASGKDQFGRKHMPAPIAQGPFYAILTHSWSFLSFGGIAVDDELRVIRQDKTPIKGLYAAGEVIGAGQTMGHSHCGGMCVTPALTFGRLLGSKMLTFDT